MPKSRRADFIDAALQSRTDQCLMWPFAVRKSSGYGAHSTLVGGIKANHDAHRFVCRLAHGEAGREMEAAHTCGNKLCINPRHLYWATHEQNMADAIAHGTIRGGGRYRQKLFDKEVREIVLSSDSYLTLAAKFGVDVPYIGRIKRTKARLIAA